MIMGFTRWASRTACTSALFFVSLAHFAGFIAGSGQGAFLPSLSLLRGFYLSGTSY